jgi:phage terminase small subunit
MKKLEPRQVAFVDQYMIDRNATQAAIRAGYKAKNADVVGPQLMTLPHIKAEVDRRTAIATEKSGVTAQRVIEELAAIGFADIRDLYDDDGALLPIKSLDARVAAAISGIDVEQMTTGRGKDRVVTGSVVKVRRHDKVRALEALGRHFKLFTEQIEHSGTINTRDLSHIERARRIAYILRQAASAAESNEPESDEPA